jgi:hypothetical protein
MVDIVTYEKRDVFSSGCSSDMVIVAAPDRPGAGRLPSWVGLSISPPLRRPLVAADWNRHSNRVAKANTEPSSSLHNWIQEN